MTLIYNAKCALYKYVWLNFNLQLTGQDRTLELAVWNLRKSFLCFFQSCYPLARPIPNSMHLLARERKHPFLICSGIEVFNSNH